MRNLSTRTKARDPRVIMCRPVQLFTASAASTRGLRHCARIDSLDVVSSLVSVGNLSDHRGSPENALELL